MLVSHLCCHCYAVSYLDKQTCLCIPNISKEKNTKSVRILVTKKLNLMYKLKHNDTIYGWAQKQKEGNNAHTLKIKRMYEQHQAGLLSSYTDFDQRPFFLPQLSPFYFISWVRLPTLTMTRGRYQKWHFPCWSGRAALIWSHWQCCLVRDLPCSSDCLRMDWKTYWGY